MKIGFIGLGKMGSNMVKRLLNDGHEIVGYDPDIHARESIKEAGASTADSIEFLINKLETPRIVWVMVPAGNITQQVLDTLNNVMLNGDIIIDGGNSNYKDTVQRSKVLNEKGIQMLDAGTSGGIWGIKEGYCLMVGGEEGVFKKVEPVFKTLAPEEGYGYMGPSGSGHFVKMVHNGIEYAMLQAYGEGFEIINAKKEYDVDLHALARLWNRGSVIRSWLLELAQEAFMREPHLESLKGYVEDSGEGRWTVSQAIEENVPAPVITLSLLERLRSRQEESFSAKVIAALRNEFGGHAIKRKSEVGSRES
jgi:6-phosphogluconate dehydrogenase